ncbi:hypothetical protein [Acidiferrobacter sp.]|uniref:hypothetical protein n=1 Tax=Acidiferrobacter sp. TaxID=1872107 RepID=UPI00262366E8|nr:hypothetical protein [Acidiferrobacter sp.]
MPRPPLYTSGPMTPAERQREKRARDRGIVWGPDGDEKSLSDSGLIEQIAIAFRKERAMRRSKSRGAITRGLVKELLLRLDDPRK